MPGPSLKLPDLSAPTKYEHRRPRRPSRLPKRLTPPPARSEPPDLSLFLYAGIVIAIVLVILAIPGIVQLLFEILLV
jgi:hypothetical protein